RDQLLLLRTRPAPSHACLAPGSRGRPRRERGPSVPRGRPGDGPPRTAGAAPLHRPELELRDREAGGPGLSRDVPRPRVAGNRLDYRFARPVAGHPAVRRAEPWWVRTLDASAATRHHFWQEGFWAS